MNDPSHSDTQPAGPMATESRRWLSIPAIGLGLIFLYPLGLFGLIKRRGDRPLAKIIAAVVTLPFFIVLLLIPLNRYWEFGGGMTFASFRLDFSRGSAHDHLVEEHRAAHRGQKRTAPMELTARMKSLSWPAFRGAPRDGVVRDDVNIAADWKKDPPRELWRQPVGEGYASIVLGGGRLYTIEQRVGHEAVTCYDAATGNEVWVDSYEAEFREPLGGDGPRATPTLDGERIFSLGARGELRCLSATDGRLIWRRNILDDFGADNLDWGMSASPLVLEDRVIVTNSGVGGGSIMAYRKADGEKIWRNDLGQQGYSSPMLATLLGRTMVLNFAGRQLNALEPETGKVLWSFPWATSLGISCSQPIVIDDSRVFISLGYGIGSAMLKVVNKDGRFSAVKLWSNVRMKNKFTSSVLHDTSLYGLDEQILTCMDADTGKRRWKGGRFGYGSVLLIGDYLLVSGEYGELALVAAAPEAYREIARMRILEGKTWNNAAMAGGFLFARNHREMVCYDLRPRSK